MSTKIFTYEEISKHNTPDDLWMIIDGKVYDCTKFLPEHPGGEEVMLDCGGIDGTQAFDDIGHSDDAREMLIDMLIGEVDPASVPVASTNSTSSSDSQGASQLPLIISILVVLAAVLYYVLNN